jgi:enoyl-[acyl-carrier protein] reductase II
LIPQIVNAVKIPVIAAGGIGTGRTMLAAIALGAEGVQIGSRFVLSQESSAHQNFKNAILQSTDGSTELSLKQLTPVRLLKNKFYEAVKQAEINCASKEELQELLGRGRAKKGMFEGDLVEGELEIGQISGYLKEIKPAAEIVEEIVSEYNSELKELENRTL